MVPVMENVNGRGRTKRRVVRYNKVIGRADGDNPEEFDEEHLLARWGTTQKQFEAHAPTTDLTVYFAAKQNMIMKKLFERMVKGLTHMASVEDTQEAQTSIRFGTGASISGGTGTANATITTSTSRMSTSQITEGLREGLSNALVSKYRDLQTGVDLQAMAQAQYNALSSTKKE